MQPFLDRFWSRRCAVPPCFTRFCVGPGCDALLVRWEPRYSAGFRAYLECALGVFPGNWVVLARYYLVQLPVHDEISVPHAFPCLCRGGAQRYPLAELQIVGRVGVNAADSVCCRCPVSRRVCRCWDCFRFPALVFRDDVACPHISWKHRGYCPSFAWVPCSIHESVVVLSRCCLIGTVVPDLYIVLGHPVPHLVKPLFTDFVSVHLVAVVAFKHGL